MTQIHKVIIDNVIRVILRRTKEDQGAEKAVEIIKIIICAKDGRGGQNDEQDYLKRQVVFTDSLVSYQDVGGQSAEQQSQQMEIDQGNKSMISATSPSGLLL